MKLDLEKNLKGVQIRENLYGFVFKVVRESGKQQNYHTIVQAGDIQELIMWISLFIGEVKQAAINPAYEDSTYIDVHTNVIIKR
jgi:hypothetical protein